MRGLAPRGRQVQKEFYKTMSDVLQHEFTGSVLKLLIAFQARWDKEHSLSYILEEAVIAGLEAKRRSKEYSEQTNNRKKFEKEIAGDPSIILRPVDLLRLCKKYGIGYSNGKFEEQVMAAAEADAAPKDAKVATPVAGKPEAA